MTETNLIPLLLIFAGGVLSGIVLTLLFNKLRSGSASPETVKRELEEYQKQVESHFDETSDKFKAMAEQYKDLYQHLSVGATTLCRPEHVVAGLTDESDPLQSSPKAIAASPESKKGNGADAAAREAKKPTSDSDKKSADATSQIKASADTAKDGAATAKGTDGDAAKKANSEPSKKSQPSKSASAAQDKKAKQPNPTSKEKPKAGGSK